MLTYNLLTALKRLRFLLFNTVGKVISHARKTLLRRSAPAYHALLVDVRQRIAACALLSRRIGKSQPAQSPHLCEILRERILRHLEHGPEDWKPRVQLSAVAISARP